MQKKELLEAIRDQDKVETARLKLAKFLLKAAPAYVEDRWDYIKNKQTYIWAGSYLSDLRKKKKISEDQLISIFLLADEKGNRWIDFISRQDPKYCIALLRILKELVKLNLITPSNCLLLLFKPAEDGWNFATLLARYQFSSSVFTTFYYFLHYLANNQLVGKKEIFEGLMTKIDKGWTFFHCIAHYKPVNNDDHQEDYNQKVQDFFDFLSDCFRDEILSGSAILTLLRTENNAGVIGLELIKALSSTKIFITLLLALYEKDKQSLNSIFELLSYCKNGNSLLNSLLKNNYGEVIAPLFDMQSPHNLLIVINTFVREKNTHSFNLLLMPKNFILYKKLIDAIQSYVTTIGMENKKQVYTVLNKLFLEKNEGGHYHLPLLIKNIGLAIQEKPSRESKKEGEENNHLTMMSKICEIYSRLFLENKLLLKKNFLEMITTEINDWTIFHLAAKYLPGDVKLKLFTFITEQLDRLKQVWYLPLENEENFYPPLQPPLNMCLVHLLADKEPYYFFLLFKFQPFAVRQQIFNQIRLATLNDRELLGSFLIGFEPVFKEFKKIISTKDVEWLSEYLDEHIERIFKHLESLLKVEKDCLVQYAKRGLGSANFILYRYYQILNKDNKECEPFFTKALTVNYIPAKIEKLLQELKSRSLIKKNFQEFCESFSNANDFLSYVKKVQHFFIAKDFLLLLEKALVYFPKEKEKIYFEIAKVYYDDTSIDDYDRFELTSKSLQNISSNVPTLSVDQHFEIAEMYTCIYDGQKDVTFQEELSKNAQQEKKNIDHPIKQDESLNEEIKEAQKPEHEESIDVQQEENLAQAIKKDESLNEEIKGAQKPEHEEKIDVQQEEIPQVLKQQESLNAEINDKQKSEKVIKQDNNIGNIVTVYLSLRHMFLACKKGHQLGPLLVQFQNKIFTKVPTLDSLYKLEVLIDSYNIDSLQLLSPKIRGVILHYLLRELESEEKKEEQTAEVNPKIKNVCDMLIRWLSIDNIAAITNEFTDFKINQGQQKSVTSFIFFKATPELLPAVEDFYKIITTPIDQSFLARIYSDYKKQNKLGSLFGHFQNRISKKISTLDSLSKLEESMDKISSLQILMPKIRDVILKYLLQELASEEKKELLLSEKKDGIQNPLLADQKEEIKELPIEDKEEKKEQPSLNVKEVCDMLIEWMKQADNEKTTNAFNEFKKNQTQQKSATTFGFFRQTTDLFSVVQDFYKIINSPVYQSSLQPPK